MRDWNYNHIVPVGILADVCSLPMRDWNLRRIVFLTKRCKRFVAYLWGIETGLSFESTKASSTMFVAYLWGIETKASASCFLRSGEVCSLPMRDWNNFTAATKRIEIKFVAYLWGIETASSPISPRHSQAVCSLPMRDWNYTKFIII